MAIIVQKFGGTSVGNIERIKHVARIIQKTQAQGNQVVAVVSAMNGETDRLVHLAREISSLPDAREYDALVSNGEQITAALLAMTLIEMQCPARSYNANQVKIKTDSRFKRADILKIDTKNLFKDMQQGIIPVITGFQGVDEEGSITTLGRGGSDMTGVAIAAALNADECQIYTDVEGVYTTDPRIVEKAQMLKEITFQEMLELSELGAKVLQIRAVEYANKHNVPLRVLSTFTEGNGTLITYESKRRVPFVSGIAYVRNQAKLTIHGLPNRRDYVEEILRFLDEAKIEIDMMVQNVPHSNGVMDFSFTIGSENYSRVINLSEKMAQNFKAQSVIGNDKMTKLSIVGMGMQSHAGVASKMFQVLGQEDIPVHLITASEIKISAIIDEKFTEQGVRVLHSAFDLDARD